LGTALEIPFSPLSFGKSFMKIRSAVAENGCLIFMHYRVADVEKNAVTDDHEKLKISSQLGLYKSLTKTLVKFSLV